MAEKTMSAQEGKSNHTKGFLKVLRTHIDRNRLGEILVTKGLITTSQLRKALNTQKDTQQPLGEIFIHHSMISKGQLRFLLGRQMALRCLAGMLFFVLSASGTKARADIADVPARITISVPGISQQFAAVATHQGLFGTNEKRSKNLKPFTKWTEMFGRFDRELSRNSNNHLISEWQTDLAGFQGMSLKRMARNVNDLMNEKRYIGDNKNWGKSDYWATPIEFIKRGGDCEDFAIAKYTALRALGVPEERLRVAIVHDNIKNIPHAVLVVYTDDDIFILDNQVKRMVSAEYPGRYRPIFSINRTAWWLHTAPGTQNPGTIIASAE